MITNSSIAENKQILATNYIGHLAYVSGQTPQVIPITYYYDEKNNCILSYSAEGNKIRSMRQHKLVSVQVEEIQSLTNWKSVLVQGEYEELSGPDAKHLLHVFCEGVKKNIKYKIGDQPKFLEEFSSKIHESGRPIVYRIKIHDISGKERTS